MFPGKIENKGWEAIEILQGIKWYINKLIQKKKRVNIGFVGDEIRG